MKKYFVIIAKKTYSVAIAECGNVVLNDTDELLVEENLARIVLERYQHLSHAQTLCFDTLVYGFWELRPRSQQIPDIGTHRAFFGSSANVRKKELEAWN